MPTLSSFTEKPQQRLFSFLIINDVQCLVKGDGRDPVAKRDERRRPLADTDP